MSSSIINALLLVGGLGFAVIAFQNRCTWFGLCGDGLFGSANAAPVGDIVTNVYDSEGNLNPAEDGVFGNDAVSGSSGCCTCEMQGEKVKCHRGDGEWFNPPAGEGGSNDTDVGLSLQECNKGCNGSNSNTTSKSSSSPKIQSHGSPQGTTTTVRGNSPQNQKAGTVGQKTIQTTAQGVKQFASGSQARLDAQCKGKPKTGMCAKANYATSYYGINNAYYNSIRRNNQLSLSLNGYKMSI